MAYYDSQQRMTVAQREIDSPEWKTVCLAEKFPPRKDGTNSWAVTGWDVHDYVVLAVDAGGYLHLSGNMHNAPLVYLRSSKPLDVESLEPLNRMIGRQEEHVTYPIFLNDNKSRLIFTYRDGNSGDGVQLCNAYDAGTKTWQRLMDQPLFSGEGEVSAYYVGPARPIRHVQRLLGLAPNGRLLDELHVDESLEAWR